MTVCVSDIALIKTMHCQHDRTGNRGTYYLVFLEQSHSADNILGQLLGVDGGGHHLPDDAVVVDYHHTIFETVSINQFCNRRIP